MKVVLGGHKIEVDLFRRKPAKGHLPRVDFFVGIEVVRLSFALKEEEV